jgi:hypothetical protein
MREGRADTGTPEIHQTAERAREAATRLNGHGRQR